MSTEHDAVRALTDYYNAFSRQELQCILSYFHEPAMVIAPSGVFVIPDSTALAATITRTLEDLRSRGYARSELIVEHLSALGEAAAFASGIAVRYKAEGQELERVRLSYLLRRTDASWKIAVMIFHDATAGPQTRG